MVPKSQKFILWFKEMSKEDVSLVGGKNASLGEMIKTFSKKGIQIPDGFALTTRAYSYYLKANKLDKKLKELFEKFDPKSIKSLQETGKTSRSLILKGEFPEDLKREIIIAYQKLSQKYNQENIDVAVRSSGVAEDLPSISKDEPVLAKFNGKIICTTIEKLYEEWKDAPLPKKLFALSLRGNRIRWYPVKEIYRHPAEKGKLFRILTKSGRKITITQNHSLIALNPDDFRLQVIGIREVNKRTRIPVIKRIPVELRKRKSMIDVREIIKSKPLLIKNGRVKIKEGLWKKQKSFPCKIKIDKNFAYFLGIYVAEGSTFEKNCIDISCESEELASKVKKYLKSAFRLSSNPDKKNVRVFSQPLVVILHELVGFPLEKRGKGRLARIKKVPELIFNQSEEIIGQFLKGCFDGDAYIFERGIEYSTVSPFLFVGIIKLLEILGIKYWITKSNVLTIPISEGRKFLKKIDFTEMKSIKKLEYFLEKYEKEREKHYDFIDNLPPSKKISELLERKLKPKIKLEKVIVKICPKCGNPLRKFGTGRDYKNKDIRYQRYYCKNCKFYPTERTNLHLRDGMFWKYINYDEKGHFKKGAIPWNKGNRKSLITYGLSYLEKIAKKIKSKELLEIVNSDVIWDRVKKIEPIEYSGYVYDLVIPQTQNFAAGLGGIITHNTASFAGQFETYLNVKGEKALLKAVKKCFASSFNDRVIAYREEKRISHLKFALSVGIQKMVRSDLASSGVMFTLDTETGFKNVVLINSIFGIGEMIVKGKIIPDEFYIFKPTLKQGYKPIIVKNLGRKTKKYIYSKIGGLKEINVPFKDQSKFSLTGDEILTLANWACQIEEHYKRAQDIEWAKDGKSGQLFIVQSRPETVYAPKKIQFYEEYQIKTTKKPILTGIAVGNKIGQGKVHIIPDVSKISEFQKGEVLVTRMTDPDWVSIFPLASAIVTDEGGKTAHAAIVSRELGLPCIVGTRNATKVLKTGQEITVDCTQSQNGRIFLGKIPFEIKKYDLKKTPKLKTKIMVNIGAPEIAFKTSFLPNEGVGLARQEFIIAEKIRIHPLALYHYDKIRNPKSETRNKFQIPNSKFKTIIKQIEDLTVGYKDKKQYFIEELAEGIAQIASAFWPKPVILRLSDLKTNEYRALIGGELFEPEEANPMLGWRGASRYYDEKFKPAFEMECQAIKRVREIFGLKNVKVMVPFCRTLEEGKKVLKLTKEYGLERGKNGLEVYVMCEIPSNVILVDQFSEIFDNYSVGSNDLTQLLLGVDRDNAKIAQIFDESNESVKKVIEEFIKKAHQYGKNVSICGEAPASVPGFVEFLIKCGIDSISVNPDSVIKTILLSSEIEKKLKKQK